MKDLEQQILIERATMEDAPALLDIQKRAFQREAALYNDSRLAPLVETLESVQTDIQSNLVLKAVLGGVLAGSIRTSMNKGVCHIGRLSVVPEMQRRGIGSALLLAVEEHCPEAKQFELFTGHKSAQNIRLYERLGYSICGTSRLNERVTLVRMSKRRGRHRTARRRPPKDVS